MQEFEPLSYYGRNTRIQEAQKAFQKIFSQHHEGYTQTQHLAVTENSEKIKRVRTRNLFHIFSSLAVFALCIITVMVFTESLGIFAHFLFGIAIISEIWFLFSLAISDVYIKDCKREILGTMPINGNFKKAQSPLDQITTQFDTLIQIVTPLIGHTLMREKTLALLVNYRQSINDQITHKTYDHNVWSNAQKLKELLEPLSHAHEMNQQEIQELTSKLDELAPAPDLAQDQIMQQSA